MTFSHLNGTTTILIISCILTYSIETDYLATVCLFFDYLLTTFNFLITDYTALEKLFEYNEMYLKCCLLCYVTQPHVLT